MDSRNRRPSPLALASSTSQIGYSPPPSPTTFSSTSRHLRNSSMGLIRERIGNERPVSFSSEAFSTWDQFNMGSISSGIKTSSGTVAMQASPPTSPCTPVFCKAPVTPYSPASQDGNSSMIPPDADCSMTHDEDDTASSSMSYSGSLSSSGLSRSDSGFTSASSIVEERMPKDCFPSSSSNSPPSTWKRLDSPCTFPAPTPTIRLGKDDLESCLRFANPNKGIAESDDSAPPAFFPLQRVSFAPQLKIKTPGGIPLAIGHASKGKAHGRDGISGLMLGVTGVVEIVDVERSKRAGKEVLKTQRMIADFATDLTNGLKIWRRDAASIVKEKLRIERQWRAHYKLPTEDLDDPHWEDMLAPGTFMLPLSMKIPCSEKLPPSFDSPHFRIRYTMSLAVFGSRLTNEGKPEILHVHSMPFHILPSTLPTPAPHIPILSHDTRKGGFLAGLSRALSLGGPVAQNSRQFSDKSCTHIICPSIPTSSYSPGSVIPITLRIADCPTEPTDLYVRLSLVRKIYVRDSPYEVLNEWGLPDDMFFEEFCREEEEIVSRWGYIPYSIRAREGATPGTKAQVIISDITLPVGGPNGEWSHGYSSQLDLGPTVAPSMKHGECSWFSPALNERTPVKSDYDRFVHASARHFISIEVGFASENLSESLAEIGVCIPEMEIPQPNTFTYPSAPSNSALSGLSAVNPFPVASSSSFRTKRSATAPFQHAPQLPAFPGKLKEILIPITIGSVAEPQMSCIVGRTAEVSAPSNIIPSTPSRPMPAATPEESAERAARDLDESEVDRYERVGDDGEEAWLCPPPSYMAAVSVVPAYT